MFDLAMRYLLSRRRQTILMLSGIFLGTSAYVAISAFMLGFREYLIDQLINNSPHIQIQSREEFLSEHDLDTSFFKEKYGAVFWNPPPSGRKDNATVENPQQWYQRLASFPEVLSFSPQLKSSVILVNGQATVPATVIGCDPIKQQKVTNISNYMTSGSFNNLASGGNRIILGSELARRLGVRMDQNISISTANGGLTPFKIVGIYRTGARSADGLAYASISDVQRINSKQNQVNEIAVKLKDHSQASQLARSWSNISSEKVESWDQLNENIFSVFRVQDAVRFLSIGSIMVVAGFGIYNVLNMTVMQKRKDIAILKSMGFSSKQIIKLFFVQGLVLGVIGAALGLGTGYGISRLLEMIPFGGGPMGAGTGYMLVSKDPWIYFNAGALALFAASIASILPARSAGVMMPIEIIRQGTE